MPLTDAQRQKRRLSRQRVIKDLVRGQVAGIPDPLGRKTLIEVRALELGLPASDAEWFFNTMQRQGWRFSGIPITDWEQTMESFYRNEYFPSQRK